MRIAAIWVVLFIAPDTKRADAKFYMGLNAFNSLAKHQDNGIRNYCAATLPFRIPPP